VVHAGLFAVSAGRHPELDGGIYFYGLDPATGQVRWQKRLETVNPPIVKRQRGADKPANTVINGPLSVQGDKLVLVSLDKGETRPSECYTLELDPQSTQPLTIPVLTNARKPPVKK